MTQTAPIARHYWWTVGVREGEEAAGYSDGRGQPMALKKL
jgi:hypothetical protein